MRTKSTFKTFAYGILFTSIIAILGLFKTKILLSYLGDEYVGIYQLFYQIYLYISIVDGGIGSSVSYRLFKPVSVNDTDTINNIMEGSKRFFNKIGIFVIILGMLLSFEIMFFIKETTINVLYIKICFILYILASAISYFTVSHAFLYESEQKLYKSSNLNHALSIAENISAIIIAYFGGKLLAILISFVILSIIKNIILYLNSRKDHKYLKKSENPNFEFKSDANNLIVNKIGNLVVENSSLIFVSKFLGLKLVTIYSAYNQIVNMIKLMIQRLNSALFPSIGNLLASEKQKSKKIFYEVNSLLFFIGNILFVSLYYMLTPFISLWYGNDYAASNMVSLLFVLILYFQIIKIPLESFVKASGKFKDIKNSSIIQAVMCLCLSLLLVNRYGIIGLLFSTFISMFVGIMLIYPRIIYKDIVNDNIINYIKKVSKYVLSLLFCLYIAKYFNNLIYTKTLLSWFIKGVIMFVICFGVNIFCFYFFRELLFYERLKKFVKNRKR